MTPTPLQRNEKVREALTPLIKMACQYYFHKEMAKTAERAQDMQEMLGEEVERMFLCVESAFATQRQEVLESAEKQIEAQKYKLVETQEEYESLSPSEKEADGYMRGYNKSVKDSLTIITSLKQRL